MLISYIHTYVYIYLYFRIFISTCEYFKMKISKRRFNMSVRACTSLAPHLTFFGLPCGKKVALGHLIVVYIQIYVCCCSVANVQYTHHYHYTHYTIKLHKSWVLALAKGFWAFTFHFYSVFFSFAYIVRFLIILM